ncbi:unnamed protein product [Heterobilharzia americana]|nr:unnamed protein product [Heterobilharzia americana]
MTLKVFSKRKSRQVPSSLASRSFNSERSLIPSADKKRTITKLETLSPGSYNASFNHSMMCDLRNSSWIKYYRNMPSQLAISLDEVVKEDSSKSNNRNLDHLRYLAHLSRSTVSTTSPITSSRLMREYSVGNTFVSFLRGVFHRKNSVESTYTKSYLNTLRRCNATKHKKLSEHITARSNHLYNSAARNTKKHGSSRRENNLKSPKDLKRLFEIKHFENQINYQKQKHDKPSINQTVIESTNALNLSNKSVQPENPQQLGHNSVLIKLPTCRYQNTEDTTFRQTRFSLHPSMCNTLPDLIKPKNSVDYSFHTKFYLEDFPEKSYQSCRHYSKELQNINEKLLGEKLDRSLKQTIQQRNRVNNIKVLRSLSFETNLNKLSLHTVSNRKDRGNFDDEYLSSHSTSQEQINETKKFRIPKCHSLTFLTPKTSFDKPLSASKSFRKSNTLISLTELFNTTAMITKAGDSDSTVSDIKSNRTESLLKLLTMYSSKTIPVSLAKSEVIKENPTKTKRSWTAIQTSMVYEPKTMFSKHYGCLRTALIARDKHFSDTCSRTHSKYSSNTSVNSKDFSRFYKYRSKNLKNYQNLIHSLSQTNSGYHKTSSLTDNRSFKDLKKTIHKVLRNFRMFRDEAIDDTCKLQRRDNGNNDCRNGESEDKNNALSVPNLQNIFVSSAVHQSVRANNVSEVKDSFQSLFEQSASVDLEKNLLNVACRKEVKGNPLDDTLDIVPTKEYTPSTRSNLSQPFAVSVANAYGRIPHLERSHSLSTIEQEMLKYHKDEKTPMLTGKCLQFTEFARKSIFVKQQINLSPKLSDGSDLTEANSEFTTNESKCTKKKAEETVRRVQKQNFSKTTTPLEAVQISEQNVYICTPCLCHEIHPLNLSVKESSFGSKHSLVEDNKSSPCTQSKNTLYYTNDIECNAVDELSLKSMTGIMATNTTGPFSFWCHLHRSIFEMNSLVGEMISEDCENEQNNKNKLSTNNLAMNETCSRDKTEIVSSISPCTLINSEEIRIKTKVMLSDINYTGDSVENLTNSQLGEKTKITQLDNSKQVYCRTTFNVCIQTKGSLSTSTPTSHYYLYSCVQSCQMDGMELSLYPVIHYVSSHPFVSCVSCGHSDSLCGYTVKDTLQMSSSLLSSSQKNLKSVQKSVQSVLMEQLSQNIQPLNNNPIINSRNNVLVNSNVPLINQNFVSEAVDSCRLSPTSEYDQNFVSKSKTTISNTQTEREYRSEVDNVDLPFDVTVNGHQNISEYIMHNTSKQKVVGLKQGDNGIGDYRAKVNQRYKNPIPLRRCSFAQQKKSEWEGPCKNHCTYDNSGRKQYISKQQETIPPKITNFNLVSLGYDSPIRPGLRFTDESKEHQNSNYNPSESPQNIYQPFKSNLSLPNDAQTLLEYAKNESKHLKNSHLNSQSILFKRHEPKSSLSLRKPVDYVKRKDDKNPTESIEQGTIEQYDAAKPKSEKRTCRIGRRFMQVLDKRNIFQSPDSLKRYQKRDSTCKKVSDKELKNNGEETSK